VKIGPVDPEIIVISAIIKKDKKEEEEKLTQAKYIALPASLPSGLNKCKHVRAINEETAMI